MVLPHKGQNPVCGGVVTLSECGRLRDSVVNAAERISESEVPHARVTDADAGDGTTAEIGEPPAADVASRVPEILRRERIERHIEDFMQEYEPVGPTEIAMVNDLARRAADMELWGAAVEAVERQTARGLPDFALPSDARSEALHDAVLAGAIASDSVERCERVRLGTGKAFYRAQQKLEERQARRKKRELEDTVAEPPPGFRDESECEKYLADRFSNGELRCNRCGGAKGCLLATRRCWECHGCRTQIGLRTGSVMARSPIALREWFEAIRWLLWQPTISTTELAHKLNVRRPSTVRNMARKIRKAMAAEDCGEQLAGLDSFFGRRDRIT